MSSLKREKNSEATLFYFPALCDQLGVTTPKVSWFFPDKLHESVEITGKAFGRGTTWFLKVNGRDLVLRHYRRGGAIAKLSEDKFVFKSEGATRPVRELNLLAQLNAWKLPAPLPIAGLIKRKGLFWTGDLISAKITDAEDAHTILQNRPMSDIEWRHIGATIKRFHDRQVYHHDLNIHNVMLDGEGQAWLIDFDKCGIKTGHRWKKANISRLLRSLKKEIARTESYHFTEKGWLALMEGYRG